MKPKSLYCVPRRPNSREKTEIRPNLKLATRGKPLMPTDIPQKRLTLGFITLIQALCQQSFGLTLPRNCAFFRWLAKISSTCVFLISFPGNGYQPLIAGGSTASPRLRNNATAPDHQFWPTFACYGLFLGFGRGFLLKVSLFVRIESGKDVENFSRTN